jgi:hypothetical protein
MKKYVLFFCVLLLAGSLCSCSSGDNDDMPNDKLGETGKIAVPDSIIIGTWELKTLYYPDFVREIPLDERDLFMFSSYGKVKVVIKKGKPLYPDLPNEDGEYDYSYDKEKQIIQLCGETLKCMISDGEMHLEGHHYSPYDHPEILEFIFIKKL